jgi:N-carbamoylputrescine amidase
LRKTERLIDQAVKRHDPHVVGLGEFFNTEYFPQYVDRKYFAYAEPIPGPTTDRIAHKAKEHGIYIIAPLYEKAGRGLYYDSSPVIAPDGHVMGTTRKVELPNVWFKEGGLWANEDFYYASGDIEHAYPIFDMGDWKLGQIICWNRHFPETWRILTMKGADVVFVPVASMGRFMSEMFSLEMRAMAYMQQCFVAVLNRVGVEGEQNFYGGSHIADPKGKLLAGPAPANEQQIVHAVLNLEDIDAARQQIPFTKSFHTSTLRTHLLQAMNTTAPPVPATAQTPLARSR